VVHTKRWVASDKTHTEGEKRADEVTLTKHVYETTVVSVCRRPLAVEDRVRSQCLSIGFVADNDAMLRARGGVAVKALRYKPAGRVFDSRWFHWNFSLT
jgi:hypothetical protein